MNCEVLLINPVTTHDNVDIIIPNLGLGYLAAALRAEDIGVDLCDGNKSGMNYTDIERRIAAGGFNVVAFQVYSRALTKTIELLRFVKKISPDVKTVVGGPHPSGDPANMPAMIPELDFAVRGEGEESFPALINRLRSADYSLRDNPDFSKIPNLIWRDGEKIVVNKLKVISDLDHVAVPAWDLIHPLDYDTAPMGAFIKSYPVAPVCPVRGCPYSCKFCAAHTITGRSLRYRSVDSVVDEISMLRSEYNIREIHIVSDCFTGNREWVLEFCESIAASNPAVNIALPNGIKINTIDKEIITALERAGCYAISMGIESGSQRILNAVMKNQTVDMVKEKVRIVRDNTKMKITGFFVMGFPGEEKPDILKTISFAGKLKLDRAQFVFFLPLPGSAFYDEMKKNGQLASLDYDKVALHKLVYLPKGVSSSFLRIARFLGYFIVYCRPGALMSVFFYIRSFQHLKYIFRKFLKVFS